MMGGNVRVVLGTSSKFRRKLFVDHFPEVSFTTASPSIDEKAISIGNVSRSELDPCALALAIAHAKADALMERLSTPSLEETTAILTLDQVVVYEGAIREKPQSEQQCREYLKSYHTNPLQTVSAVVLVVVEGNNKAPSENLVKSRRFDGVDIATQHFHHIPDHVIDKLIAKGDVMYCSGGITVEDSLLAPYLAHRDGSLESIMGLPVNLLRSLFDNAGIMLAK